MLNGGQPGQELAAVVITRISSGGTSEGGWGRETINNTVWASEWLGEVWQGRPSRWQPLINHGVSFIVCPLVVTAALICSDQREHRFRNKREPTPLAVMG
ncbi:hypothetical protein ElyMa_005631300 [Elysia marginata]|uniref:Uncharacterized protein n=1 Tax=Elysia marginata TaxID=1093978 RepID=A0AAV4F8Y7_9GAST|nr:hypothetical protein ElyMa_005631300 [Elysia marginata]